MATYEGRNALSGPLLITKAAAGTTVLEVGTRSGIPITSDMDANPYSDGITRTALIVGTDLTTTAGGQKIGLPAWVQDNLTTSMAASAMRVAAVSGQTQITIPWAGSVIGISGNLSAAITAGSLRIAASVNGATVFSAVNSVTGVRTVYGTQAKDVDALARGDRLGVKLTTSADFAPANNDLTAVVWIEA